MLNERKTFSINGFLGNPNKIRAVKGISKIILILSIGSVYIGMYGVKVDAHYFHLCDDVKSVVVYLGCIVKIALK